MACWRCGDRGYVRRWVRGLLFIDACPECASAAEREYAIGHDVAGCSGGFRQTADTIHSMWFDGYPVLDIARAVGWSVPAVLDEARRMTFDLRRQVGGTR